MNKGFFAMCGRKRHSRGLPIDFTLGDRINAHDRSSLETRFLTFNSNGSGTPQNGREMSYQKVSSSSICRIGLDCLCRRKPALQAPKSTRVKMQGRYCLCTKGRSLLIAGTSTINWYVCIFMGFIGRVSKLARARTRWQDLEATRAGATLILPDTAVNHRPLATQLHPSR